MAGRKRRKNRFQFLTKKFPVRMQRKLVLLFIAVILAFLVLVGRITYINVTKGSKYTKLVLNQKIYDSKTIPYKRGDILDRNGTKIATSERVYNVILDVVVMTDKEEYIDYDKLYKVINTKDSFYLYINKNRALIVDKNNLKDEDITILNDKFKEKVPIYKEK